MSNISAHISENNHEVTISVLGRFDFSVHKEFRATYASLDAQAWKYILDLSQTEYMDSSALGMILLLRDHVGGVKERVVVRNARSEVDKILRIANFDKLLELV